MEIDAEEIKAQMQPKIKETTIPNKDYLSSGSTLLNLACSGRPRGCFAKGHYYWLVGDSTSGKTFLSLSCLAEASLSKHFKDYRFILDEPEDGALMDIASFFGTSVADRLERRSSESLEEWFYNVDDDCENERPFIGILDSMDALQPREDSEKFQDNKEAFRSKSKKQITGSYGTGKAKANSAGIRTLNNKLRKNGSIQIIISQTRDNIGFGSQFNPKTTSGGNALKFYATLQLWSSVKGHIKKKVNEKDRELGIYSQVRVKKNRLTGRDRSVSIPIYHSHGIDDVGACIDFLIDEGHWKCKKGVIECTEWSASLRQEALIRKIEKEDLEVELQSITTRVWNAIEAECIVNRKSRYHKESEE